LYTIAHWDLDGIVSTALVVRHALSNKHTHITKKLSTANALPRFLREFKSALENNPLYRRLFILDLNPLPSDIGFIMDTVRDFLDLGVRVYWIDHHVWFSDYIGVLRETGVELVVDTNRVTAEIVADYLGLYDSYSKWIVEIAVDDDLFLNRLEETVCLRRVLRWCDWSIRYRVLESFINGEPCPKWVKRLYNSFYREYEELLRESVLNTMCRECSGLSIAVTRVVDDRVHPGEIQSLLEEEGVYADIYVIVYSNGVSLRSDYIDVSVIAHKLGGSGHPRASGFPLNTSLEDVLGKIISYAVELRENTTS